MRLPEVVRQDEWLRAGEELLAKEKELTGATAAPAAVPDFAS
jgi:predicted dithiol-disulfide oxidoreductase (DUF899 family)